MNIEVIETKFKGYDIAAIQKDIKKLTKRNIKMGKNADQAFNDAIEFIDYYKHTYRVFK